MSKRFIKRMSKNSKYKIELLEERGFWSPSKPMSNPFSKPSVMNSLSSCPSSSLPSSALLILLGSGGLVARCFGFPAAWAVG